MVRKRAGHEWAGLRQNMFRWLSTLTMDQTGGRRERLLLASWKRWCLLTHLVWEYHWEKRGVGVRANRGGSIY